MTAAPKMLAFTYSVNFENLCPIKTVHFCTSLVDISQLPFIILQLLALQYYDHPLTVADVKERIGDLFVA